MANYDANINLTKGTNAQIISAARPNMLVHNTTDKSLVYSEDGITLHRYPTSSSVMSMTSAHNHTNKVLLDTINQPLATTSNAVFTSVSAQYVDFVSANPAHKLGRLHWSDDDKTLDLDLDNGSVLQIGQETLIRGQNNTGSTILNGRLVYINGAQGNRPTFALADADILSASPVIAIATQDISNNNTGYFTTFGVVRDLNTSQYAEGTELFLSTSAGLFTSQAPVYPNEICSIGYVIRSHTTQGSIFFTNKHISKYESSIASPTELNSLSGISTNIQSQLNNLSATAHNHANKSTLDLINQSLNTSATVSFSQIDLGKGVEIGSNGNTDWLQIASFPKTENGLSRKYYVTLMGGDWADNAKIDYVFDTYGSSSSSSAFDIGRIYSSWIHNDNEIYSKIEFKTLRNNSTDVYDIYVRGNTVDFFTLGADVKYTHGSNGAFRYYVKTSADASLPTSATHTNILTTVREQPSRMLNDVLYIRNTNLPRTTNFSYTNTSAVGAFIFEGTSFYPENSYSLGTSTKRWNNVFGLSANIGSISATSITVGSIDNTEFGYLNNVSANIQNQLSALSGTKANSTVTITAGTMLSGGGDLSTNRTISHQTVGTAGTYSNIVTNSTGHITSARALISADIPTLPATKIGTGIISDAEFNFLDNVSANIQTQLTNLSAINSPKVSSRFGQSGPTLFTQNIWAPSTVNPVTVRFENYTIGQPKVAEIVLIGELYKVTDLAIYVGSELLSGANQLIPLSGISVENFDSYKTHRIKVRFTLIPQASNAIGFIEYDVSLGNDRIFGTKLLNLYPLSQAHNSGSELVQLYFRSTSATDAIWNPMLGGYGTLLVN